MTFATDQNRSPNGLSENARAFLRIRELVFEYWESQVRLLVETASNIPQPILTNTLPAFYDNIAEAMTPGYPRQDGTSNTDAMAAHGGERARMTSLRADQLIREYQIFRDAIYFVAENAAIVFGRNEVRIIDQSIDAAIVKSIREFVRINDMQRARFAATLSHGMRNPLGLVLSSADIIAASLDLAQARHAAQRITTGARRIESMLTQLVDSLTVDQGIELTLSLSRFDIRHLLDTVCEEFDVWMNGQLEIDAASIVGYWCQEALRRALENLISNAFKYGDGHTIVIKAGAMRGRLILSVHNTGNPIPDEQRGRIFDYLHRADAPNREGWGIGLRYARGVAEGHGGGIAVDSSIGGGTTFMIDVPIDCRPFVKTPQG